MTAVPVNSQLYMLHALAGRVWENLWPFLIPAAYFLAGLIFGFINNPS